LVIQKPGEDDDGAGKIVIPYRTDLTNIGNGGSSYTPAIPENLNTFSLNEPGSTPDNSLFNYYRNADNSKLGVLVKAKDNSNKLFVIERKKNNVQIGSIYYGWSGNIHIGGEQLTLYGKEGINIELADQRKCTLSSNENNLKFKNTTEINFNKEITIPYGTDLTNLETRLTTLESGSGGGSTDYNKTTFRKSIIDYTSINTPLNTLKQTITSGEKYSTTMKTLVNKDIFPKFITLRTLILFYLKLQILHVIH
jgi:hypothetical protein